MTIWVIIDPFKSDDVIRKAKNEILGSWERYTPYDVIMTSK